MSGFAPPDAEGLASSGAAGSRTAPEDADRVAALADVAEQRGACSEHALDCIDGCVGGGEVNGHAVRGEAHVVVDADRHVARARSIELADEHEPLVKAELPALTTGEEDEGFVGVAHDAHFFVAGFFDFLEALRRVTVAVQLHDAFAFMRVFFALVLVAPLARPNRPLGRLLMISLALV